MARIYYTESGNRIKVEDDSIYAGGEGAIYRLLSPADNLVAKIYTKPDKAKDMYKKIQYMVNNSPVSNCSGEIHDSIIWPKELLFENKMFVGYVMPFVNKGVNLYPLTLPNLQKSLSNEWKKFERSEPEAHLIRLKICYNLARVISVLHTSKKYVLVDLKPQNIIIKIDGHFSIIDLDSLQIADNRNVLFGATAFTEDYAPAEFFKNKIDIKNDLISISWDNFAFAIIAYQILLAIHPYMASHQSYTSLTENIQHGVFANGSKRNELIKVADFHKGFKLLSSELQTLFIRAFEHGNYNPDFRPCMEEWGKVLKKEIESYAPGQKVPQPFIRNSVITANAKKRKAKLIQKNCPKNYQNFAHQIIIQGLPINNLIIPQPIIHQTYSPIQNFSIRIGRIKHSMFKICKMIGLAIFALALLIISFLVFNSIFNSNSSFISKIISGYKSDYTNISGSYFGTIQNNDKQSNAYLKITKDKLDTTQYKIYLKYNIKENGITTDLVFDNKSKLIHATPLGDGIVEKDKSNGKVKLISSSNNKLLWQFVQ